MRQSQECSTNRWREDQQTHCTRISRQTRINVPANHGTILIREQVSRNLLHWIQTRTRLIFDKWYNTLAEYKLVHVDIRCDINTYIVAKGKW